MEIRIDRSEATYQIRHYEPGRIQINDTIYPHSVIVRNHQLLSPWRPQTVQEVVSEDFNWLKQEIPSIILFGTGEKLLIPPEALLKPLFEMGAGVEFMDSKAAAYTYTILSSEGRNVAACLLIR